MNNKSLIKALKEKSMLFSLYEIQQIMDEELNKKPEEMDIKLVDLCTISIEKGINKSENNKAKRIKFNKIAVCVAIITIIFCITIPVTAAYIKSEIKNTIITQYKNSYEINLNNANDNAKKHSSDKFSIIKDFEDIGLDNIILPQAMLKKSDCAFDDLMHNKEENLLNARINFNYSDDINGVIYIFRGYTDEKTYDLAIIEAIDTAEDVRIINNNGMDILIECKKQKSYIMYKDNNTIYHIHLENCSLDDAVNISYSIE